MSSTPIQAWIDHGIDVYDVPPEGWRRVSGTNTEPLGYEWWSNGRSRFGEGYRHALVRKQPEQVTLWLT